MKSKGQLIFDLLNYINRSEKETTDTIIAKAILENRYELDELSLEELSEKCFISQPSISRFIKKLGYKNYNAFKQAVNISNYHIQKYNTYTRGLSNLDLKDSVKNDILHALSSIDSINLNSLSNIVEIMKDYQNIVFMGSALSMAITYKLQIALSGLEKNVYTLYEHNYQEEMLHLIEKRDDVLMICISIEGRWISKFKDLKNIKELPYKILWTLEEYPEDEDLFDLTYHFGNSTKDDIGYNELMYFILLVTRMILNS